MTADSDTDIHAVIDAIEQHVAILAARTTPEIAAEQLRRIADAIEAFQQKPN